VFCVPVLFSLIRSRAKYFCWSDRNFALVGWLGRITAVGMTRKTALSVSERYGGGGYRSVTHIAPETMKIS